MTVPGAAPGRGVIDKRALLFPICSGTLGFVSVAMQIVAVATPYWAHFKRERYPDSLIDGLRSDPLYEEGHYGLWTVCLTVFDGKPLAVEDCITNIAHFHPSSWRIFAGIIATINVVLSLLFLAAIPLQVKHLKTGTPMYCKYKTLTRIQMVLSIVGVTCAIMAAVLFGIHSHHKHYKEPKGWSFGLQIIVIVVQVFLFISTSAENVVASRIDQNSPAPQFLFTLTGSKKKLATDLAKTGSFRYPSLNPTLSLTNGSKLSSAIKRSIDENNAKNSGMSDPPSTGNREFSRDNPIFVDSDNDSSYPHGLTRTTKGDKISIIHLPVATDHHVSRQGAPVRLHNQSFGHGSGLCLIPKEVQTHCSPTGGTAIGRFKVEKIADLYSTHSNRGTENQRSGAFAYCNQGYCKDSEEFLPNAR